MGITLRWMTSDGGVGGWAGGVCIASLACAVRLRWRLAVVGGRMTRLSDGVMQSFSMRGGVKLVDVRESGWREIPAIGSKSRKKGDS